MSPNLVVPGQGEPQDLALDGSVLASSLLFGHGALGSHFVRSESKVRLTEVSDSGDKSTPTLWLIAASPGRACGQRSSSSSVPSLEKRPDPR